jgi:hypothetical protein
MRSTSIDVAAKTATEAEGFSQEVFLAASGVTHETMNLDNKVKSFIVAIRG